MKKSTFIILVVLAVIIFVLEAKAYTTGLIGYYGPDINPTPTTTVAVYPVGSNGQVLVASSTATSGLEWENQSITGGLLAANNLSDLNATATARTNLGYTGGFAMSISSTGTITFTNQGYITTSTNNFGGITTSTYNGNFGTAANVNVPISIANGGTATTSAPSNNYLMYYDGTFIRGTSTIFITTSTNNFGGITTSTYNASMTIATAAPLGGGGQLSNNGQLNLTCAGCLTSDVDSVYLGTSTPMTTGEFLTVVNGNTVNSTSSYVKSFNGSTGTINYAPSTTIATNDNQLVNGAGYGTSNVSTSSANTWTGAQTHNATTTFASSTILSGSVSTTIASALVSTNSSGVLIAYGGASACGASNAVTTISISGGTTCAAFGSSNLATSTLGTYSAGSLLFFLSGNTWSASSSLTVVSSTAQLLVGGGLNASSSITINGIAVSTSTGANPTASVGTAATNGTANTFMRSDGSPALSASMTPVETGLWQFSGAGASTTQLWTASTTLNGTSTFSGNIQTSGSAPTATCATGGVTVNTGSSNNGGSLTNGSSTASCTVTFTGGGFTNRSFCNGSQDKTISVAVTSTKTTVKLTGFNNNAATNFATGTTLFYICVGQ